MRTVLPDDRSLRTVLEGAGFRCTPQRLAVYQYLTRAAHHPTAEEVYHGVRSVIPKISLATVYKALEALVATGMATKLTAEIAAMATGCKSSDVFLASTGVIGEPLDARKYDAVMDQLVTNAAPGAVRFRNA